jgi:hypothetical protein
VFVDWSYRTHAEVEDEAGGSRTALAFSSADSRWVVAFLASASLIAHVAILIADRDRGRPARI